MSINSVLDYLTTNNITCNTWLNCGDLSTITVNGNLFTIQNSLSNSDGNFIQSNLNLHPKIESGGLSFDGNKFLQSTHNLLNNEQTYSVIVIYSNLTEQFQTLYNNNLFSLETNDKSYTHKIDYYHYLESRKFIPDNDSYQILLLTHKFPLGVFNFSIDRLNFLYAKYFTGMWFENNKISYFRLGNNFKGILHHFLLFSPGITSQQLIDISDLLSIEPPVSDLGSLLLPKDLVESIELNTVNNLNPFQNVSTPVNLIVRNYNDSIELEAQLSLLTNYFWEDITYNDWTKLTYDDWINIE